MLMQCTVLCTILILRVSATLRLKVQEQVSLVWIPTNMPGIISYSQESQVNISFTLTFNISQLCYFCNSN
jgi:hypothetical protein